MNKEQKPLDRSLDLSSELSHVDALMRKLAEVSPRQAPQRVRLHMEHAVRRYRSSQSLLTKRWLLAAAALFLVLAAAVGAIISKRSGHTDPISEVVAPVEPQPPRLLEPQRAIPKTPSRPKTKRHQQPKIANPQPFFVRLPFSDPALMSGTSLTVRLALSEAELLAMGVRPIETDPSRSYVADLILGDDGLPRAIRIVSHGPTILGGS